MGEVVGVECDWGGWSLSTLGDGVKLRIKTSPST